LGDSTLWGGVGAGGEKPPATRLNEAAMRQKKQKSVYNSSKYLIPDTYNKKEYTMKSSEVKRFAGLYERHLKLLKLQGKSDSTMRTSGGI
jgi:hypothetical protein